MKIKSMKEYYEYIQDEKLKDEHKKTPPKRVDRYFLLGKGIAQMANKSLQRTGRG